MPSTVSAVNYCSGTFFVSLHFYSVNNRNTEVVITHFAPILLYYEIFRAFVRQSVALYLATEFKPKPCAERGFRLLKCCKLHPNRPTNTSC